MSVAPRWSQRLLLITTAGPAAVSLASSLVALKCLGVPAFGQWMAWRALFLLAAIPTPGFNIAQQVLVAEALALGKVGRAFRVQRYCDRLAALWVAALSLITLVATIAYGIRPEKAACLAVLFSGLFTAAYTTSQIIGNKDSIRTVRGGIVDVLGGLATIAVAFSGSLDLYILAMGLRYWFKAMAQYAPIPPGADLTPEPGENIAADTRRVGVPLMLRAFVRDAAQYGDKPILSHFYSNLVAGVAGVGSILATVAVMLANTATSYLLPVLIGADRSEHARLSRSALSKVFHAAVVFALFIPLANWADVEVGRRLDLVALTFFIIAGLSLLSPIVVPWTARGEIWRGTILTGTVIGVVGLIMIGFGLAHAPVRIAMAISTYVVFVSVGWALRETDIVSSSRPMVVAYSILGATVAILYAYAVQHIRGPLFAIVLGLLGLAYGCWAGWEPIKRHMLKLAANKA